LEGLVLDLTTFDKWSNLVVVEGAGFRFDHFRQVVKSGRRFLF